MTQDPAARYLPPGFPLPDREAMARLRETILRETATAHPPEWAELAALITADEAGVDLSEVDPREVWSLPPDDRQPLFLAIARLLQEMAS